MFCVQSALALFDLYGDQARAHVADKNVAILFYDDTDDSRRVQSYLQTTQHQISCNIFEINCESPENSDVCEKHRSYLPYIQIGIEGDQYQLFGSGLRTAEDIP